MSRRAYVYGMLSVCLAVTPGVAEDETGMQVPWNKEAWSSHTGTWEVDGEEYAQLDETVLGAVNLWREGGPFVDVDVRVRFRIEDVGDGVKAAGIAFRAVDAQHLFFAHFDSRNDQLLVSRWSGGRWADHLVRVRSIGLKQNTWHEGRVRCIGRKARVFLDGRLIGEADGVAQVAGRVGIRAGQGRVRFRDFIAEGERAKARAPLAEAAWWHADWSRRIPIDLREPGDDEREACLARVTIDFGGAAHGFGTRDAHGRFDWTDVAVVDATGSRIPSAVLPHKLEKKGEGSVTIMTAEVQFPVTIGWFERTRYYVYYDNPAADRPREELNVDVLSFASLPSKDLPAAWKPLSGAWAIKPLSRPDRSRDRVAAVVSDRHVAFPGICRSATGDLLVVYREGYTHASGNPDDGRIMLVRSSDNGRTWGAPELVTDDPAMDDRNAAISCMEDGTLVVIFDKWLKGDNGARSHHWAWLTQSIDEGRTWSDPIKVSRRQNVHTRSRALDLGDGTWLIPYSESTGSPTAASCFAIFDPRTEQFEVVAATPLGQRNIADETAVTRAANGDLIALIRSNQDPELWQIRSTDNGRTWSEGRWSGIPSQFTPCDLVTLTDGRLLCSFSFRERRNERLVISRDHGKTWDVENSIDVFDGTPGIGGDRSYPASVQLDDHTVGTVLYETRQPPRGGHIWFVTTPLAAFEKPTVDALWQGDPEEDHSVILWSEAIQGNSIDIAYRFTGRFGPPPNRIGVVLDATDADNYVAVTYQMGVDHTRRSATNQVQLIQCVAGKVEVAQSQTASGGWFQDGNVHRLGLRHEGQNWIVTLDGMDQFETAASLGRPRGIIVNRSAVAVYDVTWSNLSVQRDMRPLDIELGTTETHTQEPAP